MLHKLCIIKIKFRIFKSQTLYL